MGRDLEQRTAAARGREVEQEPTLRQQVAKMEAEFQKAMPKGAEAVQLVRDVYTCIQQNPKLADCPPNTVLGAAMTCAQLGLRPGVLGHAWILPYWDGKDRVHKAQLIVGYQGLVDLGYRSGLVKDIGARIVYERDEFRIEWNARDGDQLIHRPYLDGDPGNPRLYYAVARTTTGGYAFTRPMTVAEMERHRDKHGPRNRQGKLVGPWTSDFDGMGMKTMVRKLMKLLPKSTAVAHALAHDDGVRYDTSPQAINVEPEHAEPHLDAEVVEDAPAEQPVTDETLTTGTGDADQARATLENGDGKPLAVRIEDLSARFALYGVTAEMLERKQGRATSGWTAQDVASLTIIGKSIRNGETTVEDEFPFKAASVDELVGASTPPSPPAEPAPAPTETPDTDRDSERSPQGQTPAAAPATPRAQKNAVTKILADLKIVDEDEVAEWLTVNVGRDVTAVKDLTTGEAAQLVAEYNQEGK